MPFKQSTDHLEKGKKAETIACKFLLQHGLKLKQKNYQAKTGEIDLIMQDRNVIVFVEVRYRKSSKFGLAQETVTPKKQQKLIRTAEYFLIQKKLYNQCPCRFDIVAIQGTIPNHQINWISDAFST